ncbi:MAG: glycosyltransferase family 1 protein [Caldilinea sp. CFX5]|nr:glycosyltransferase family 1 protein [Caldilinea sp. CFX5]
MTQPQRYTFGFLLEQTLGHRTHSQNLQANVPKDPTIRPVWEPIEWNLTGLGAHIPVYNSNWTVRAGLRARRALRQIPRQNRLDALFVHTQVPAVLLADWMKRLPTIVSLDATPRQYDALGAYYAHNAGPGWLEMLKWRANVRCFQQAHKIVAWSQWTKAGLIAEYGVPTEKIVVIPPGVNTKEWRRSSPQTPTTAGQNEPVKLLFVGGDLQRKGGELLLQAFRLLRQEQAQRSDQTGSAIELHLVTRDPVAAESGLFVYNNMQPNSAPLKALFHSADIFCLPTYGDCLPMVLSEAGAAELPAVATNVAGIGEIVKDGETGLLIPTGDVPALTKALRTLIENPSLRRTQGAEAARLVQREFDAERNTERLLTLMKQSVISQATSARSLSSLHKAPSAQ